MSWERLSYKGGKALVIGVVLEFIGIGLCFLTLMVPYILGQVYASLLEVADVFTIFGIFAWYGSLKTDTGTFGFNGFVVAMTGLLLGGIPTFSRLISGYFTLSEWRC